jgi:flavin reductase (DIM6/NTAB) family NADH-FMN oxidoreductase RutF
MRDQRSDQELDQCDRRTSSGSAINKFEAFRPTPDLARKVKAPLIRECHANLECKLDEARLVRKYNFFVFEVVRLLSQPPHGTRERCTIGTASSSYRVRPSADGHDFVRSCYKKVDFLAIQ